MQENYNKLAEIRLITAKNQQLSVKKNKNKADTFKVSAVFLVEVTGFEPLTVRKLREIVGK